MRQLVRHLPSLSSSTSTMSVLQHREIHSLSLILAPRVSVGPKSAISATAAKKSSKNWKPSSSNPPLPLVVVVTTNRHWLHSAETNKPAEKSEVKNGTSTAAGESSTPLPPATSTSSSVAPPVPTTSVVVKVSSAIGRGAVATGKFLMSPGEWRPASKKAWASIKEEAKHYWAGFKAFAKETALSWRILKAMLHGHSPTRREYQQLKRTTVDLLRLIPFSVFVIVPFMELLLPVTLFFFPNMLPSTFKTSLKRKEELRQQLKLKLEVAKFLQSTVVEMANNIQSKAKDVQVKNKAAQFEVFMDKVQNGENVSNEELLSFAPLFTDDITLDNISRPQLVNMCKLLSVSCFGTDPLLRYRLEAHIRAIKKDDKTIVAEGGVETLSLTELQDACAARGMRGVGLKRKVPVSLLILSRALVIHEQVPIEEAIAATMQSMPEELVKDVVFSSGETDATQKLEYLERQEELLKEEWEEKKRREAQTAAAANKAAAPKEAAKPAAATPAAPATAATTAATTATSTPAAPAAAPAAGTTATTTAAAPSKPVVEVASPAADSSSTAATKTADAAAAKPAESKSVPKAEVSSPAAAASPVAPSAATPSPAAADAAPVVEKAKAPEVVAAADVAAEVKKIPVEDDVALSSVIAENQLDDRLEEVAEALHMLTSHSPTSIERESIQDIKKMRHEKDPENLSKRIDRLQSNVDKMLAKLEKEVSKADAKIGESMRVLDLDRDGAISLEELDHALVTLLNLKLTRTELMFILTRIDPDGDGIIQVSELSQLVNMARKDRDHELGVVKEQHPATPPPPPAPPAPPSSPPQDSSPSEESKNKTEEEKKETKDKEGKDKMSPMSDSF